MGGGVEALGVAEAIAAIAAAIKVLLRSIATYLPAAAGAVISIWLGGSDVATDSHIVGQPPALLASLAHLSQTLKSYFFCSEHTTTNPEYEPISVQVYVLGLYCHLALTLILLRFGQRLSSSSSSSSSSSREQKQQQQIPLSQPSESSPGDDRQFRVLATSILTGLAIAWLSRTSPVRWLPVAISIGLSTYVLYSGTRGISATRREDTKRSTEAEKGIASDKHGSILVGP